MSDLHIGLSLIGVAIVVAVLLFNWVQERRFRKQADAAFQKPMADVLMQTGAASRDPHKRVEPALREPAFDAGSMNDVAAADVPDSPAGFDPEPAEATSPAWDEPAPEPAVSSVVPPSAGSSLAPYDELIEYRVRVSSDGVDAAVFAEAFNHARTLGKAVRWLGLPVGGTEWEEVLPWRDARYEQVAVTMQLADRNGAVQAEQLDTLCALLLATAQANGLRVACDDISTALERAQAIDRFCVDVDVLIGLNVVARSEGAVSLAHIVHAAASRGMVLGADGAFELLDSRGEPLYALCNHDAEPFSDEMAEGQATQGVTLQFDVPRVPDGLKVFDDMVAFGRKLANEVGGVLVDDNLRPLTEAGIEKIRNQLMHIYERMDARGVPSGSRRSLRLFS